ncbi:AI-2E family transporter [Anaerotignum sp.]|uniref:AI-2E family transporter n=1 Tax=Anaerotignum sp. TaxID=2039241 RepID=UPI002A90E047|nr:AI-2E family transporter [Anaerotignum sp.]MCI7658058.1 AI-2E family transporter [Clostridia bacterium]MDY5414340.1 AI-2E family transporter [Anaerotignum sp.]
MSLDKENMKKICLLIVFTLAVFVGLWRLEAVVAAISFLGGILAPFILGGAIAFILSVPMNRIEIIICKLCSKDGDEKRRKKREKLLRPFSMILTLILVIAILALAVLVIFPELGRTVSGLGRTIQANVPILLEKLEEVFHNNKEISYWLANLDINWDEIIKKATNIFQSGADIILGSTFSMVQSIFSGVTTFVIGFVFACYILIQKEKLGRQCRKLLFAYLKKHQAERVLEIASLTHRTFAKFLTGQCLEAVILGTMFFVAMTLLRFPYALLVGVLIAITALIPIFGAFIGCVVAAFLILMVSPMQALAFIVLFLVLQQLEGNFIYPHVVGGSVGLPSIWVLVAVTVGGSLMGIVGMLIFIPLMSVLYTLLRQDVAKRLEKKQLDIS